jgi:uncharacterized protein
MRNLLIATAAAATALPAAALAQAQAPADSAIISFAVSEEVKVAPDRASIGAGVTTSAATAVEALRANSAAMDKLIAAAKKAGIRDGDIQTSQLSISPQYDYRPQEQGQPPKLIGYQASNQVNVVTRDIKGLGGLIDAMIAAGGTNISGPNFYVANPDALLDGARAKVMAKANAKAAGDADRRRRLDAPAAADAGDGDGRGGQRQICRTDPGRRGGEHADRAGAVSVGAVGA